MTMCRLPLACLELTLHHVPTALCPRCELARAALPPGLQWDGKTF